MSDERLIEAAMNDYVVGDAWDTYVADQDSDDPTAPPVAPRTPPDVATASAIMRKIRALTIERDTINATVDAEIARLEAFRADATSGLSTEIARGELAIEAFTRQWSTHAHKKTLSLPGGSGKLRDAGKGKLITHDAGAFERFVADRWDNPTDGYGDSDIGMHPGSAVIRINHPDLVRVKVEPVADALKALTAQSTKNPTMLNLALPDGTVVPGVHLERATEDNFTLTIEGQDR